MLFALRGLLVERVCKIATLLAVADAVVPVDRRCFLAEDSLAGWHTAEAPGREKLRGAAGTTALGLAVGCGRSPLWLFWRSLIVNYAASAANLGAYLGATWACKHRV